MKSASSLLSPAVGAAAVIALGAGCAHQPSKELLDAREAYDRASNGPAARFNPGELHEAQTALEHANQEYATDPGSDFTKDVAYIALRKAEIADIDGKIIEANQQRAEAEQRVKELTQQQLAHTQRKVKDVSQSLEADRQARARAEQQAREALSEIAKVRSDSRGVVITLTGGVLFASGKSTLFPSAREKLDQVAEALKRTEGDLIVEGHTDSLGSTALNRRLSQARADTVRSYLIDRGVPAERIRAEGLGKSRPVASNQTSEGRANNRRVEIVVAAPAPNAG